MENAKKEECSLGMSSNETKYGATLKQHNMQINHHVNWIIVLRYAKNHILLAHFFPIVICQLILEKNQRLISISLRKYMALHYFFVVHLASKDFRQ